MITFGKIAFLAIALFGRTATAFEDDGKDYICCRDSCGTCKGNSKTNNANKVCPASHPDLCERVICCDEDDCGGSCREDQETATQCEAGGDYVCKAQPYLCCDNTDAYETCERCDLVRGWLKFKPDSCVGPGMDVWLDTCKTVKCCKNSCTSSKCTHTHYTAVSCEAEGYNICGMGGIMGDPHIETWDHKWFDFHGVCDLEMLSAPEFEGVGLAIHVRTSGRDDYSFISSAAVKIGEDVLEVSSYRDYSVNGVFSAKMPAKIGGYTVTHDQINKKKHVFKIDLGFDEVITVMAIKDIVSISIENASSMSLGRSVGLLGKFGDGDRLARDGKTIIEDPIDFGNEWQVRNGTSIFNAVRAPQFPDSCIMPTAAQQEDRRRRLGETQSRAAAEAACDWWGPEAKDRCVFDVLVSGDLDLAQAGP